MLQDFFFLILAFLGLIFIPMALNGPRAFCVTMRDAASMIYQSLRVTKLTKLALRYTSRVMRVTVLSLAVFGLLTVSSVAAVLPPAARTASAPSKVKRSRPRNPRITIDEAVNDAIKEAVNESVREAFDNFVSDFVNASEADEASFDVDIEAIAGNLEDARSNWQTRRVSLDLARQRATQASCDAHIAASDRDVATRVHWAMSQGQDFVKTRIADLDNENDADGLDAEEEGELQALSNVIDAFNEKAVGNVTQEDTWAFLLYQAEAKRKDSRKVKADAGRVKAEAVHAVKCADWELRDASRALRKAEDIAKQVRPDVAKAYYRKCEVNWDAEDVDGPNAGNVAFRAIAAEALWRLVASPYD